MLVPNGLVRLDGASGRQQRLSLCQAASTCCGRGTGAIKFNTVGSGIKRAM